MMKSAWGIMILLIHTDGSAINGTGYALLRVYLDHWKLTYSADIMSAGSFCQPLPVAIDQE